MIHAVLDTNTIVSGGIVPGGVPGQILRAAQAMRFQLVTSQPIVDEIVNALQRDRIRQRYHISPDEVARIRRL